jgi:hypothetical protein
VATRCQRNGKARTSIVLTAYEQLTKRKYVKLLKNTLGKSRRLAQMTEGQILKKYKRFFGGKDNLVDGYGLQCDDGWYPLIEELLGQIVKAKPSKDFKIVQIKEKFGGLRVYVNGFTDEIRKLIDTYADRSFKTCEWCGKTKNVKLRRRTGVIKTLCDIDYKTWKDYERGR